MQKHAIIIGAGPAGLTAALELLRRTDIKPIILEADHQAGGISRTVHYKGNRMDIGGHRFFSKSDRVMQWWLSLMPVEGGAEASVISYQNQSRNLPAAPQSADGDLVMLLRPRRSRIYYLRKFFSYPITLTADTLSKLGLLRTCRIGVSYIASRLRPRRPEKTLEDFLINRFGATLYRTFFKSYTEKVWGMPCSSISADWGAQRVKALSLTAAVLHFFRSRFTRAASSDIAQKSTNTSLIERFLYPRLGPGQLWEKVASMIIEMGGEIHFGQPVDSICVRNNRLQSVSTRSATGEVATYTGDYYFSTMPVRDLVNAIRSDTPVPENIRDIANGLLYRDFITVGILASHLAIAEPDGSPLRDTWIYIQEPDVRLGRLQIFNNWSPHLVADPETIWLGLEYFCNQTDDLWRMPDDELKSFAAAELEKIGILHTANVLDAHVVRMPKTYPAYFGTYNRFPELRTWLDAHENLFLIGRNGMHKYNNQDHSMLTAMTAVDQIIAGNVDKSALWEINTEQEYHEKSATPGTVQESTEREYESVSAD